MTNLSGKIIESIAITGGGLVLFYGLFYLLKKFSKNRKHYIPGLLNKYLHLPGFILFIVISFNINIQNFKAYLPRQLFHHINTALHILLIASIGFLLFNIVNLFTELVITYYKNLQRKDYTLRSVKTKYQLIQKVVNFLIIAFSIAAILMTFDAVRQFGGALLASASVAGLVIGFAAQKSLGALFSGIQIAITQPIKLDDTILIKDTFGTVGEITLTYVVINTWDEKRLILPINYFLEQPVENWTRDSPEVISKVVITADFGTDINALRHQFEKWLSQSPYWDKRNSSLFVIDADAEKLKIRATMSAKDSKDAFALEYAIREQMVSYLKDNKKTT